MEGAAALYTPSLSHGPSLESTYSCQVYTLKGCGHAIPNRSAPIGEHGSPMGTEKQKANTVTITNIQYNELIKGSTLTEKLT